ncbi:MAG: GNAT family protein [Acidobacteriota bacterium]
MSKSPRQNHLGQPIGPAVEGWRPPPPPPRETLIGRWCRLEPLDPQLHADDLFAAYARHPDERHWTYLGYGPFTSSEDLQAWMAITCLGDDPLFYAIRSADGAGGHRPAGGLASYLRIDPAMGVIEVGHLSFAPALRRTAAATEAMYLMMRHAFALGYRRYEWKCDDLNAASRRAALRLGFRYEGTFRQASIYKGRNRDTAWYSILDREWPGLEARFQRWLARDNFDADGRQRKGLGEV